MRERAWGGMAWLSMTVCVAGAQTARFDRSAIFIDPAHGGADAGARLGDRTQEKDATLGLSMKLGLLLVARGFHVTTTRSGDLDGGTLDQRAELANRSHAVACLVLHASPATHGAVVGTSALGTALMRGAGNSNSGTRGAVPWSRGQEAYVALSGKLANQVGTALMRSGTPVTMMRVVMRPLDNLMCPAISIELGIHSEASDDAYQQRVAESIADVLTQWRSEAQAPDDPATQPRDSRGATR